MAQNAPKSPKKRPATSGSFVKGEVERIEALKQSCRDFVKTLQKRVYRYDLNNFYTIKNKT